MIKIIFLGTNGWFDTCTGNTTSILLETDNYSIILDAGSGISKLRQYINYDNPVYLFLSHFHIDHISGLHTLAMNKFTKGLNIITPSGGREILKQIINSPFTVPIEKLPFHTEIIEISGDTDQFSFKASFLPLAHSTVTLGARFEIDNKIIAYCTDTGYCDNAVTLAHNADVLIAECSMKSNETDNAGIHLNPEMAAEIAKQSNAKKLMLMHFDAKRYPDMEARIEAELGARKSFTDSYMSWDGQVIEV